MACQELEVALSPNARPSGNLAAAARPQGGAFCRTFEFQEYIQTLVTNNPLITFAGERMVTFG